ncbi:MAG: LPS-assembly protein LptD [Fibrobacter sp.]|nr:LPS-assembly protein LptD [Fibrobacter sp.]
MQISRFLLLLTLIFPVSPLFGAATDSAETVPSKDSRKKQEITDSIFYESDLINYDAESQILNLHGKALVKYQNIKLIADTITYDIENNLFTATGMPQLIEGGDTTVGDYMVYNIKTRRGRVRYASTSVEDGYFTGQRIVKSDKNELYVDQGDYTTCAHIDTPDYYFYGKSIKLIPNDKIISRPVVFNIGDAPVAVLPYFIFPLERNRRSGLLTPIWGGHPTSGGYVDNIGYYFAPNDYLDFLIKGKISEFRQFVLEGGSSYAIKYLLNGRISGRYAFDSEFQKSSQQWEINYSHNQKLTPDGLTQLYGSGRLVSHEKFYVDNSELDEELLNQNVSASMSLSRRLESINASAAINWKRDYNLGTKKITEDLPSFNFSLPSRPFFSVPTGKDERWYNKIYFGYNMQGVNKHKEDPANLIKASYRPGITQSLDISAPQVLFGCIDVNPSISARVSSFYGFMDRDTTGYDTLTRDTLYMLKYPFKDNLSDDEWKVVSRDTITVDNYGNPDSILVRRTNQKILPIKNIHENEIAHDAVFNAGVSLSTKLYGIFPIKIFNFAALRHTLTPSISYTLFPEHKQKYDFFDIEGIPVSQPYKRRQEMGLRLHNQFDGKIVTPGKEGEKPTEKKFPILSVDMSTSYDFEKDSLKFSDLRLSASTNIKGLSLSFNSDFWLYDQNNNLHTPIMKNMSLNFSTGTLGLNGKLWGGDLLVLDSLHPNDPVKYANAGPQEWSVSLSPRYTYTLKRTHPSEMFVPEKYYSLSASASLKFTRNWGIQWSSVYNFMENQWVQNSFRISCDMECWDMRFEWRPEKLNPGYYFLINIKKIPEIKWEKRN